MKTKPFLLHALSPLHAGTGHADDIIEMPTARMKATRIPFVPGSSIKGVLRDARRNEDRDKLQGVFGPDNDHAEDHAGALVVSEARLLALPVRSFHGTFSWVTSPLLLTLAQRDLGKNSLPIPNIDGRGAKVTESNICVHNKTLYLEDLDLPADVYPKSDEWCRLLAPLVSPGKDIFTKRFSVIDDETMDFLWETATQIDARIRLDEQTRTAADGALWLEESLPSETMLIGILAADKSRRAKAPMTPNEVLKFALPDTEVLQFGGKASVGRGRCQMVPMNA
jgi:CRISPR-associated protein Cmr4